MALFLLLSGSYGEMPVKGGANATFAVSWYDVGVAALDGRQGVVSVKKGWYGLSEVNHVAYDPEEITVEQLIGWLKESGTYIRTISDKEKE